MITIKIEIKENGKSNMNDKEITYVDMIVETLSDNETEVEEKVLKQIQEKLNLNSKVKIQDETSKRKYKDLEKKQLMNFINF